MTDAAQYPGTPRWVKVSGTIAIVVVLLFVILQLTGVIGRHGPGRHGPGRHGPDHQGQTSGPGDHAPKTNAAPGSSGDHGAHTPHPGGHQ